MNHLESYLPTTLKTVFSVNNGMKNVHITRLLHGDSDKASSYNPMGGIYDEIFVSGRDGPIQGLPPTPAHTSSRRRRSMPYASRSF